MKDTRRYIKIHQDTVLRENPPKFKRKPPLTPPAGVATADGQRKQAVRRGQAFDWLYSYISCDDLRQLLSDLAETAPADGLAVEPPDSLPES